MSLFGNSCKKLQKNYDMTYTNILNRADSCENLPINRKRALFTVLSASDVIITGFFELINENYFRYLCKLSNFVDKDANVLDIICYSCFMQLDTVYNRMNNKVELKDEWQFDFDFLVSDISNLLDVKEEYFNSHFQYCDKFRRDVHKDSRDLIISQRIDFIQLFLKRNFDFRECVSLSIETITRFSLYALNLEIAVCDIFDGALKYVDARLFNR